MAPVFKTGAILRGQYFRQVAILKYLFRPSKSTSAVLFSRASDALK
jgi:hypothetical protein